MTKENDVEKAIVDMHEAVDEFSLAMKVKMEAELRLGISDWHNTEFRDELKKLLDDNIAQTIDGARDLHIDIANCAMMLWFIDSQAPKRKKGAE